MKKKIAFKLILIGIIVIILAIILIVKITDNYNQSLTNIPYRRDEQPIRERFPNIPEIQSCYWKANAIGRTDFGPTNYWMKGFIVLEESEWLKLLDEYSWENIDLYFPKGIDPRITNFNKFNWAYNKDFELRVKTTSFVGGIYLDTKNGILYFSVENS